MSEPMIDVELRESRFTYLLQPIRDLAANWDINIAAELEEYLEELEGLTFAIEGEGVTLNFAEAALLIQGTTCVYSKKVEHLHNLVYQALETIMNKRQKEKQAARSSQDKAAAGATAGVHDVESFLCLEDTLQEANDIDMPEDEECAGGDEVLRPPTALLALEDAAAGQGEGDAGSFRLAQCSVHTSGALLLELQDGDLYDSQLRCMLPAGPSPGGAPPPLAGHAALGMHPPGAEVWGHDDADDHVPDDWGGADDGFDDIDLPDTGGAGAGAQASHLAAAAHDAGALPEWLHEGSEPPAHQHGTTAGGHLPAGGGPAAQHAQHGPLQQPAFFDPYKPLDYADTKGLPCKPLKVRKPRKRDSAHAWGKAGWCRVHEPRLSEAAAQLNFPEFAAALDTLLAAQRVTRPRLARQAARQGAPAALARAMPVMDWADVEAAQQRQQQEGHEQQRAGGADDLGADAADASDGDAYGGFHDAGSDGGDAELLEAGLAAEMEEAAAAGMLRMRHAGDADGVLASSSGHMDASAMSYEDLCRSHIDALITAAAAQQVQSELQVRVSTWRQRIDPILRSEEDRSAFDIHQYGERILGQLAHLALEESARPEQQCVHEPAGAVPCLDFAQVVSSCSNHHEVSRTFAAMLQLINNCNVRLQSGGGSPDTPFQLQLLSSHMLHKRIQGASGGELGAVGGGTTQAKAVECDSAAGPGAAGVENKRGGCTKPTAKRARRGKAAAA